MVDCEDGVTAFVLQSAHVDCHVLDVAGRDIAPYLKLLLLKGYEFNESADFEIVQLIKERLCQHNGVLLAHP